MQNQLAEAVFEKQQLQQAVESLREQLNETVHKQGQFPQANSQRSAELNRLSIDNSVFGFKIK